MQPPALLEFIFSHSKNVSGDFKRESKTLIYARPTKTHSFTNTQVEHQTKKLMVTSPCAFKSRFLQWDFGALPMSTPIST